MTVVCGPCTFWKFANTFDFPYTCRYNIYYVLLHLIKREKISGILKHQTKKKTFALSPIFFPSYNDFYLIHTNQQDIDNIPYQPRHANRFHFILPNSDINKILILIFITERNEHKCKLNLLPWQNIEVGFDDRCWRKLIFSLFEEVCCVGMKKRNLYFIEEIRRRLIISTDVLCLYIV